MNTEDVAVTLRSVGKLRYSPTINGSHQRRDGGTTKHWLVIDCDPEIGRYYRQLYKMAHFGVRVIHRPAWEAHISVVCDEPPPNPEFWLNYEGQEIEFDYVVEPESNGLYVWFPVICERALDIREELGLTRNPKLPLHLTIGNSK